MGTRGLFGFVTKGKVKMMYNHYDSYPDVLGRNVVEFVANNNATKLKEIAESIRMVNTDTEPTKADIAMCKEAGIVDLNVNQQSENDWYCLLRKLQGDLNKIAEVKIMSDDKSFAMDGTFCEWGYLINTDTEVIEAYEGCNNEKSKGRFAQNDGKEIIGDEQNYPITLVAEIPFINIVKHGIEHVMKQLNNLDGEN